MYGIDARLAGEQAREPRAARAGHRDGDARLQDRVALGDAAARLVEDRPIQRVRHRADQLPRRVARQLGVAVEHDHVLDVAQPRRVADDGREGRASPRSAALSSSSLPRLRSQPIHTPSRGFSAARDGTGRTGRRLGARIPPRTWRSAPRSPSTARANSASSPSICLRGASRKSLTSAKARFGSRFARKRTSRASTSPSTSSSVGEHRRHRDERLCSAGMPVEKSRRGKIRGRTSSVAAQCTSANRELARRDQRTPTAAPSGQPRKP